MIMNLEVTLEEMRKQAEEKGIQKGRQKGLSEGKIEGELKGKLEVARAALIKGFSLEDVASITGLDKDMLAKLDNEIKANKGK